MDERMVINNEKIFKDNFSKNYVFLIAEAVLRVVLFALYAFVIIFIFAVLSVNILVINMLVVKIVVGSIFFVISILKILSCIYVIYTFKKANFTVEIDAITKIKPERVFYIREFITTRLTDARDYKFSKKVIFKKSGSLITGKDMDHCSVGDRFYLVKIKILNKNRIVGFYSEKAYRYEGNSDEK